MYCNYTLQHVKSAKKYVYKDVFRCLRLNAFTLPVVHPLIFYFNRLYWQLAKVALRRQQIRVKIFKAIIIIFLCEVLTMCQRDYHSASA